MANNTTIQKATNPGDIISTEDIGGGVKIPRSKVVIGNYDSDGGDVSISNPMPVKIMSSFVATETAGGSVLARTKLILGDSGTDGGDVSSDNPLPVTMNLPQHANVNSNNSAVASGSNAPVQITLSPSAGLSKVIGGVAWSYAGGTPNGQLFIMDTESSATVFSVQITNPGPGFIPFNPPISTGVGNGITVLLAAGGSSVTGSVNILGSWQV